MKRVYFMQIWIVFVTSLVLSQTTGVDTKTKASPLVGSWKANLLKSRQHVNHQFQSAMIRIELADNAVLLTFSGVNMSGQQEGGTRKLIPDGKEYPIVGAAGYVEVTNWLNPVTLENVAKKDGKVIGRGKYEVSGDGKTMTATLKGLDASGLEFEQVIVFDRQ